MYAHYMSVTNWYKQCKSEPLPDHIQSITSINESVSKINYLYAMPASLKPLSEQKPP